MKLLKLRERSREIEIDEVKGVEGVEGEETENVRGRSKTYRERTTELDRGRQS